MSKSNQKFIVDIVPLTKIPFTNGASFSYLHNSPLPSGTLVSIPLFRRTLEGVVLTGRNDFSRLGNIELKKISSVEEEHFLNEKQIELAKFISEYYISPLGVVMKNFVPKRTKTRILKKIISELIPSPVLRTSSPASGQRGIILTKSQEKAVKEIAKKNNKFLLFGPSGSGKTEVYIHSILKLKQKNKNFQFLILLPEKTLTPQAAKRYGEYFNENEIVFLSSNLSKKQLFLNWQKIKNGEAKIIIGTRMAVFAPFKKIGLIIIDEEQDMSYKQWDMNPRYDARTVAEELAQMHACPLVRGSATPNVESYWRAMNKEYQLLELPRLELKKIEAKNITSISAPNIDVVDMKKERWSKNYSCISKKLKAEITFALKYNQQVILLINRQGMSAFSICAACKTVLRCPKCERALLYDQEGVYKCAHCAYKTGIFPKCAHCGGIDFKNVGLGTQKVEKEIKDFFPSARLGRLDSQTTKKTGEQEKIYLEFSQKKIDILIGTQMITKGWDLPNLALVGIIDADNLLFFPDFTTEERAFQILVQISGRVGRPRAKFSGNVVIQAFRPENEIIKLATEKNFTKFYESQIAQRKALHLPPCGKIIKLIFQDYKKVKVDMETEKAHSNLSELKGIKISDVHSPLLSNIRGRFRRQIILKIIDVNILPKIKKELRKLENGWIIDVDPISLI